ncbi:MAG TPA: sigma factor [Bryobacteraceae bacterium]|nr:sigma factor [Bryobacteraceae bacterium]
MAMYTDDPIEVYLSEVAKVPPMTRERELECVRYIHSRDEHADVASKDLLEANLALVVAIARRHPCEHIQILDLIQTGNNALFRALQAFTDSDDEDFSAFATPFIEKAIVRQIATPGW